MSANFLDVPTPDSAAEVPVNLWLGEVPHRRDTDLVVVLDEAHEAVTTRAKFQVEELHRERRSVAMSRHGKKTYHVLHGPEGLPNILCTASWVDVETRFA